MVGKVKAWVGRVEGVAREVNYEGWVWISAALAMLLACGIGVSGKFGGEAVVGMPFWLVVGLGVAGWPLTILFTVSAGRSEDDELGNLFFLGFIFGPVATGFFDGLCLRYFLAIPSAWCAIVTIFCAVALWVVAYIVEEYLN